MKSFIEDSKEEFLDKWNGDSEAEFEAGHRGEGILYQIEHSAVPYDTSKLTLAKIKRLFDDLKKESYEL